MVGKVDFELKGVKELERALQQLGPRVARNASGRALRAMAKPVVKAAKAEVPVRTGALKKSITAQLRKARGSQRTIEVGFRSPISRRAHLVEYGTAHSAAHPFIRPALDTSGSQSLVEMSRVLADVIEKEARKRG